jgi:hypothetical protein
MDEINIDKELSYSLIQEAIPEIDRAKSRRSLIFYNKLASHIKKSHPEAEMLIGAYNVYTRPPEDTTIKADPMLNVIICHFSQYCQAHPVPDPTCPRNKSYLKLIKEWENLVGNNILFYEYYYKVHWMELPLPIVHCIKEDIPWYKEQGYKGLYTQYSPDNIWTLYPNYYLTARLLWDSDSDVDYLIDKMYEDLFKKAAPWIKKYYGIMEKSMSDCGEHFSGGFFKHKKIVFTEEVQRNLREYYEEAVKVNEDAIVSLRLEKIGTSLEYIEQFMRLVDLMERAEVESDPEKAFALTNQALGVGEALLSDIRINKSKWDGVLSRKNIINIIEVKGLNPLRKKLEERGINVSY